MENIAQNYELDSVDYISKVDAVNVSTIHKVKGLEYPVVFVVDLVNQRFPGKRGQYNGILPEELMTNAIDRGLMEIEQKTKQDYFIQQLPEPSAYYI